MNNLLYKTLIFVAFIWIGTIIHYLFIATNLWIYIIAVDLGLVAGWFLCKTEKDLK